MGKHVSYAIGCLIIVAFSTSLVFTGLSGPTAAQVPQPLRGGTLTVSIPPLIPHLDTNSVSQTQIVEVVSNIYERLYERDASGKVKPLLVKEETLSPDGLTVTRK